MHDPFPGARESAGGRAIRIHLFYFEFGISTWQTHCRRFCRVEERPDSMKLERTSLILQYPHHDLVAVDAATEHIGELGGLVQYSACAVADSVGVIGRRPSAGAGFPIAWAASQTGLRGAMARCVPGHAARTRAPVI